ncbi:Phosphoric monoester hydrolase [Mycena kentingensis (nom. inval.)]|nr:Phosphoric monoester hydrolase [Mycena kentingensis (nom. inval.)]
MASAFFYGTLMHPRILCRVIGNDGSHLKICPAVLLEHTRHKVLYADYPGVIPYSKGRAFFDLDLERDARCVRGTLVTGLTEEDTSYLDTFEGDEYLRRKVPVHPLEDLRPLADYTIPVGVPVTLLPSESDLGEAVEAETYIYGEPNGLLRDIWDFDEFVAQNAWKWYGGTAPAPELVDSGLTEVERRRAVGTTAVVA